MLTRARPWLAGPRRLLVSFVLLLMAPAIAVVWLGGRWLAQDRDLAARQRAERRQVAADRAVTTLEQALATTERQLVGPLSALPVGLGDDAAVLTSAQSGVASYPPGQLLYQSASTNPQAEPTAAFAPAELLEYQQHDYAGAVELLRELTRAESPPIQAGAWLRLARNLRRLGRSQDALRAYDQLSRVSRTAVNGLPTDLTGRRARCAVLQEIGSPNLPREAAALRSDLVAGRWPIDHGTLIAYFDETTGWIGDRAILPADMLTLADAASSVVSALPQDREAPSRSTVRIDGTSFVVLRQRIGAAAIALIAGPRFQQREWFDRTNGQPDFVVSLTDGAGHRVFGPQLGGPAVFKHSPTDSGLPWTLAITERDPNAGMREVAARRRLAAAALGALVVVVIAGGAFTARAMSRELAVAQLQADFVATVSHEFRTPLTALRQFTDLLDADVEPAADKRRAFYRAQARATERLQRLVESVLDFGRMEAGAAPYRLEDIDATALIERVCASFQRDAAPAEFVIEVSLPTETLMIHADADALTRAAWNLLENAVKYGGDSRTMGVRVSRNGGLAAIAVRDQGIGIPQVEQKKIFDKFVRGETSRTRGIPGTGIGLSMVRHIVTAHRGHISVESEPGRGSTFTIWLPLVPPSYPEFMDLSHAANPRR